MEIIESTLGIKMKDPTLMVSLQEFCAAKGQEVPPFRLDATRTDRDLVRSWAKLLDLVRLEKREDLVPLVQTCLRLVSTRSMREIRCPACNHLLCLVKGLAQIKLRCRHCKWRVEVEGFQTKLTENDLVASTA